MKHFRLDAITLSIAIAAVALSACTTAQTDKFVAGLDNFNRGVAAVDASLQRVNSTLYANCTGMVSVASSINEIAAQCSRASPYTSVANAVINNYCQSNQLATNGGIAASVNVTASSLSAAKSTLAANRRACASGG